MLRAVALLCVAVALCIVLSAFFRLVEPAEVGTGQQVDRLPDGFGLSVFEERQRFLSAPVHFDDFPGALGTDGLEVGPEVLVGRVSTLSAEDIGLEEMVFTVHCLQEHFLAR